VVQQHAARNLHWDLRLEIDGVLVSWAIPRGPSLDPGEKRLAVQTEDHPMAYGDFEGVIPEGNYGAGAMIVWDRGTYRSVDDNSPAEGLEVGKIDLWLEGHKLRGRFALVRTKRGAGKDWLFFKKGQKPEETEEIIDRAQESVYSGFTVGEVAERASLDQGLAKRAKKSGGSPNEIDASKLRPMLAKSSKTIPPRDDWLYELKYDGVRALVEKQGSQVRIFSRSGGDRTHVYPEIAAAAAHLPVERCILDGELVSLDAEGRSSFERLQRRFTQTDSDAIARARRELPVLLYAFDLISVSGVDVGKVPIEGRKRLLGELIPPIGPIRFADHLLGDGAGFLDLVREQELEGIVAKRAGSTYQANQRSEDWCKIKVPRTASLAIVGVVAGKGSRKAMGSLMLAGYVGDRLVYCGNVGSGLGEDVTDFLEATFASKRRETAAFENPPDTPAGSYFVEPEQLCEVRFTEVTSAGNLRHPVFLGLRDDLTLEACVSPAARALAPEPEAPAPVAESELQLTRLDKVFWPVEGYTKGDLLAYHEAIWPWLAPYLKDRPLVLTRYPDGIEGKNFYQKNAPEFTPAWATRTNIDGTDYFVCNELDTLLYVINSGAIPLHVWSSRVTDIEHPDWLILDLDPKEAPFADVVAIARHIHKMLGEFEVAHFAKTSGQDGLHIFLPMAGQLNHKEVRSLAEVLARIVVSELPEIATVTRPIASRGGKVYVDFGQNARGQLIAAPFSVRPRPGAPVSTPLRWPQVTKRLDPVRWNLRTTPKQMAEKGDSFAGVLGKGIEVASLFAAIEERMRSDSSG
jgi:bifunctional non-homologous end joining protein LigD